MDCCISITLEAVSIGMVISFDGFACHRSHRKPGIRIARADAIGAIRPEQAHVRVGLVIPSLALLLGVRGLFYLVWFPLPGRDLLRAGNGIVRVA